MGKEKQQTDYKWEKACQMDVLVYVQLIVPSKRLQGK